MASLYLHKRHGWQIHYTVYFINGSHAKKIKYAQLKQKAALLHHDADKLEFLSLKGQLTQEEIAYFIHRKLITPDDAQMLTKDEMPLTDPSMITWDSLKQAYESHVKTVGSEFTRMTYPYLAEKILKYFKDEKNISPLKVHDTDIKDFISWLRTRGCTKGDTVKGCAKATCNKYLQVLRIMFDYLIEKKLLKENPARKIKAFSELDTRAPRILFPDEFKNFTVGLKNNTHLLHGYFAEIMLTYIMTGMRRSELLNLKTKDINFDHGYLIVRKDNNIKRGRTIHIHPQLMRIFESVIRKNLDRIVGKQKVHDAYFFGSGSEPLVRYDVMTRTFDRFRKAIKLPSGLTLHSLRHTFITYMLSDGADLRDVMNYTGHKKLSTIQGYLQLIPKSAPAITALSFGGKIEKLTDIKTTKKLLKSTTKKAKKS
jgi:site-specific recombinase XerD